MFLKYMTGAMVAYLTGATPLAETPAPKVTVTAVNTPGPNFWVKIAVTVSGNPDSTLYSVKQGTSTVLASSRRPASVVRDSFSLVKPPIGSTTTGSGCAQTKRRGLVSNIVCKAYSFTTPDAPPPDPVVDVTTDTLLIALRMLPRPTSMLTGTAVPLCMIAVLPSGRAGYRGARSTLCDQQAATLGQVPTATGQRTIDAQCYTVAVVPQAGATGTGPVWTPQLPCQGVGTLSAALVTGLARFSVGL